MFRAGWVGTHGRVTLRGAKTDSANRVAFLSSVTSLSNSQTFTFIYLRVLRISCTCEWCAYIKRFSTFFFFFLEVNCFQVRKKTKKTHLFPTAFHRICVAWHSGKTLSRGKPKGGPTAWQGRGTVSPNKLHKRGQLACGAWIFLRGEGIEKTCERGARGTHARTHAHRRRRWFKFPQRLRLTPSLSSLNRAVCLNRT